MTSQIPPEFPRAAEVFGGAVAIKAGEWETLCPAHDDHKRSLWIKRGERGLVLACRAGCKSDEIVKAAGLALSDLFPERPKMDPSQRPRVVATYTYTDAKGKLLYQVQRTDPKGFRQRRRPLPSDPPEKVRGGWVYSVEGVERALYRLPEVLNAKSVVLVEGEKDADRVASLKLQGLAATTAPMGAGKWQPQYTEALSGRRVVILPDNDEPGLRHARDVAAALEGKAESVRIVELPGLPTKGDVSDWLDAGNTREQLVKALRGELQPAPSGNVATPPAEELSPIDALLLAAVAAADGPDAKTAAARLASHLRSKGVLA